MKRYNIKYYHICSDGLICALEPADDGEFVKYADVEKEFERIAALFATEQDDTPNQEGDDQ